MRPTVLIPWAPGTNCHHETAWAFERVGAKAVIRPLRTILETRSLSQCDILALAGGFSWGDHFGSGRVMALDLANRMRDEVARLLEKRVPVIGICNGFQVLVNLGLLPGDGEIGEPTAALDFNLQYRFEHMHHVQLSLHEPTGVNSIWTKGLDGQGIYLPVAHGEGRLVTDRRLNVIATYGTTAGETEYPTSPNGSPIAGICSDNGLIMGMMPHPERRVNPLHGIGYGQMIFAAGVAAVS